MGSENLLLESAMWTSTVTFRELFGVGGCCRDECLIGVDSKDWVEEKNGRKTV